MPSVHVVYGFCEGDWHGRHFKQSLQEAGFAVTDEAHKADIIITHSGGPYALPANITPRQVVFINPVYWPGKTWLYSFTQKVWRDYVFHRRSHRLEHFWRKNAMNLLYLFRLRHSLTMLKHYNTRPFRDMLPSCPIVVIRNSNDPWCTPALTESVPEVKSMYELPGEHDDCWLSPQPYVDLLQSTA
jgi:hypothetical protein